MSQVLQLLESILSDRVAYEHLLSCRGTVAQRLLDLLQDILDSSHELRTRPSLSKALVRLSIECGIHPTCCTLEVKKVGQQVAGGGFGDIWKGLVGDQIVAVKSMRQFADDDVKVSLKKFGREALIWRQLSHPNLLPFFGMYILENRLCLVSPWMDNGDLKHFLGNAPSDIDRVSLIVDISMGLEYLHGENIVHGDLKTPNILVTPSGRACISDFGLSTIVDELSLKLTFSSRNGRAGTVRYQAPELLKNESPNHYGSDVYAFACVSYEILSGQVPFFEIPNDVAILLKVIEGVRPSRFEVITPDLWLLLEDCWHQEVDKRPATSVISQRLLRQPIGGVIKQSLPDWDDAYTRSSINHQHIQIKSPLMSVLGHYQHLLHPLHPYRIYGKNQHPRPPTDDPKMARRTADTTVHRRLLRATRRFTPLRSPIPQAHTPARPAPVRQGRFKADGSARAVKSCTESSKRDLSDARGYYARTAGYMSLAALSEALDAVGKAIISDPNFTEAYIRKSTILFDMQNYTKAIEAVQEAREHDLEKKHVREIAEQEMKCLGAMFGQRGTEMPKETLEWATRPLWGDGKSLVPPTQMFGP
ncbi:Protein kinase domain-containing protein [Mycena sanguinolenta]|uniref:Protein kinase domain-containing protein n=1 Tax=Mycena sanguinolenta TaxID=230812 RepID=A0A8H6Y7Z7_9AGAR|nr:Protein kinase domain-containing protein [Mycena sanguinolenta]